jgi:hypothetical protein
MIEMTVISSTSVKPRRPWHLLLKQLRLAAAGTSKLTVVDTLIFDPLKVEPEQLFKI